MKVSPHLHMIEKDGHALCWHTLRGNLYILEPEYLKALGMIRTGHYQKDGIMSELLEAGYVIDDDTNERNFFQNKNTEWMKKIPYGGQLRMLNLMISEACNFGCLHCLHKCSINTSSIVRKKLLMDWQTAKTAINGYVSIMHKWDKPLIVHFGSAEPLLNYQVLSQAINYIRSIDENAMLTVNTNLSLLTRKMAEFFRDNHVFISTSLDGPLKGNDAIRQFKNKKGTYQTITEKFKLLDNIGYPLDGFSITLNDLNFDEVDPKFIQWAHYQNFTGIATDIDLINMIDASKSVVECVEKLLSLRTACQDLGIENFGSWTTAYDNLVNDPEDKMPTFCKAAKGNNVSVNADGMIFICGHTTSQIGELSSFEQVFYPDSPYTELIFSRLPGNDPMCVGCEIEGVCSGQCQITREVASATGNGKDTHLCQFYRLATRMLLERKLAAELKEMLIERR